MAGSVKPWEIALKISAGKLSAYSAILVMTYPYAKAKEILEKDIDHNIKMVMAPQNETAAGVTIDPKKIRNLLDELKHPALVVIDGISSIGSMPVFDDRNGHRHASRL